MSAKVKFGGIVATVQDGEWSCDDPVVFDALRSQAERIGTSPSIPDLDEHLAQDQVNEYGAVWVQHSDRPPQVGPPGTVN